MKLDANAKYRKSHEWIRKEGSTYVVGISDHAQESLGAIVFVELPAVGKAFKQGETFGVVESVKAASDVYLPMSGKVVAVNAALEGAPDLINREPYAGGWLVKIEASAPAEWDGLLAPSAYEAEASKE